LKEKREHVVVKGDVMASFSQMPVFALKVHPGNLDLHLVGKLAKNECAIDTTQKFSAES
jgi:hypothetical protein